LNSRKVERLAISAGGLRGWRGAQAGGIEDIGFDFAFVALGRDILAV
jgi:hypothetical protein